MRHHHRWIHAIPPDRTCVPIGHDLDRNKCLALLTLSSQPLPPLEKRGKADLFATAERRDRQPRPLPPLQPLPPPTFCRRHRFRFRIARPPEFEMSFQPEGQPTERINPAIRRTLTRRPPVSDAGRPAPRCQWALKGDQAEALQRRPVGLTRRESVRLVVWHVQPSRGTGLWRTDWQWIKYSPSRV